MKKSDIKVGTEYAVVRRWTQRYRTPIKATVVEIDAPRERRRDTFASYRYETVNDGIRLRFDEPVTDTYENFKPVSQYSKANLEVEYYKRLVENAYTEAVVTTKEILEPWAERVEREERHAREHAEWTQREDERNADKANEFAPKLAATLQALKGKGFDPVYSGGAIRFAGITIQLDMRGIGNIERPVGFERHYQNIDLDEFLAFLGVER